MHIGKYIKEGRLRKGLTQTQLAIKLGYGTPQFVALVEQGKSKLPHDKIKMICKILGLDKMEIFRSIMRDFQRKLWTEIR